MSDFTLKDRDGRRLVLCCPARLMNEEGRPTGVRLRIHLGEDVNAAGAFDLDGPLLDQLIAELQRRRAELPDAPKQDGSRHGPATYRAMLEPFADTEEASAAFAAFERDLYAARCAHRIADVSFGVEVHVLDGEGEEGVLFAHGHHGSEDVNERLVARMYGAVGERARQRRARLAAGEGLGAARRVRP